MSKELRRSDMLDRWLKFVDAVEEMLYDYHHNALGIYAWFHNASDIVINDSAFPGSSHYFIQMLEKCFTHLEYLNEVDGTTINDVDTLDMSDAIDAVTGIAFIIVKKFS